MKKLISVFIFACFILPIQEVFAADNLQEESQTQDYYVNGGATGHWFTYNQFFNAFDTLQGTRRLRGVRLTIDPHFDASIIFQNHGFATVNSSVDLSGAASAYLLGEELSSSCAEIESYSLLPGQTIEVGPLHCSDQQSLERLSDNENDFAEFLGDGEVTLALATLINLHITSANVNVMVNEINTFGSMTLTYLYETLQGSSLPCIADTNGDGRIDGNDLSVLLSSWGRTGNNLAADFNQDRIINGADLSIFLANMNNSQCQVLK